MKFGIFLAPLHRVGENPTLALNRDMELIEWLDYLGYDEVWIGEHHSASWELIASPEIFIGAAGARSQWHGVVGEPPPVVLAIAAAVDHRLDGREGTFLGAIVALADLEPGERPGGDADPN